MTWGSYVERVQDLLAFNCVDFSERETVQERQPLGLTNRDSHDCPFSRNSGRKNIFKTRHFSALLKIYKLGYFKKNDCNHVRFPASRTISIMQFGPFS